MKKTINVIILIMSLIFLLSSCETDRIVFFTEKSEITNRTVGQITKAVNEKNATAFVNLFSETAKAKNQTLQSDAESFIDFIEGDIVKYYLNGGKPSRYYEMHYGKNREEVNSDYIIETTQKKYQIAIKQITADDFDANNVGIECISIVEDELWNETFPDDPIYNGSRYMEFYGINIHRTADDLLAEG